MTGDSPVLDPPALWAALSNMQIEEPGTARRFEETLAQGEGWPIEFAERVTDEYRRFLFLAATAGFEITPSQSVDEAWHLHLDRPHYREVLCRQILGRPLEHRPATGEDGEAGRHAYQYEQTIALYERVFLEPPPSDIWPVPLSQEEQQADQDRRRSSRLLRRFAGATALAALAAYLLDYPFVGLFFVIVAASAAALAEQIFPSKNRSRRDDDGGVDLTLDGDSGCGGGCGGGCGS